MSKVSKVAVIGAGIMGRGIAHVCALGGCAVELSDISEKVLQDALQTITTNLKKGVEKGKLTQDECDATLSRIHLTQEIKEAVTGTDLVIETASEDIRIKLEIFRQCEENAPAHAIFASNTSTMSITEMAGTTKRPDKVVGLHFFNPPHLMKLIEIIRGLETSQETIDACAAFIKSVNKESVTIKEYPGLITSRINAMIGNEAFFLLGEGVATAEDIDKAMKLGLNHPMGPFEMGDLVGLDTRLHALEYLQRVLGDKFRPAPLMVQYVKAGRLGRKTGRGVYDYTDKK